MRKKTREARRQLQMHYESEYLAGHYEDIGEQVTAEPQWCSACGTRRLPRAGCVDSSCRVHYPPWEQ